MWRVTALMKRRDGMDNTVFQRAWTEQLVPAIQAALERHGAVRRLVLCVAPPALSEQVTQVFPAQFDGMLTVWFERAEDTTAAFAALGGDASVHEIAAQVVSAGDSVVFAAKAIQPVLQGDAGVTFLAGSGVAKNLSLREAQDYYVNVHPRVVQSVPEVWKLLVRYAQFCGDPTTTLDVEPWLAKHRFIPLASEMGFAAASDFVALYSHPAYMSVIRPDEQTFSDASDMVGYITGDEVVLLDKTAVHP